MSKQELLSKLMKQTRIEDVKKIVYQYLYLNYDDTIVTRIVHEVLRGNFEDLTHEDIDGLLKALGHDVQPEIEQEDKVIKKSIVKEKESEYETTNINILKKMEELQNKLIELEQKDKQKEQLIKNLSRQLNLLKLSETQELIEIDSEDVDKIYIEYLTNQTQELNNAYVFELNGKLIIPKSYYEIKKFKE